MKIKYRQNLATFVGGSLLAATQTLAGCATTNGSSSAPATYKMSTAFAPGVAVPDKVESSIGTLNLNYGYPDNATTQKIYDNLDASRALQAYLLAIPSEIQLVK
jgi:hypothetical protein